MRTMLYGTNQATNPRAVYTFAPSSPTDVQARYAWWSAPNTEPSRKERRAKRPRKRLKVARR